MCHDFGVAHLKFNSMGIDRVLKIFLGLVYQKTDLKKDYGPPEEEPKQDLNTDEEKKDESRGEDDAGDECPLVDNDKPPRDEEEANRYIDE